MDSYRYKAFISYSHVDEKVVRWLHRRLESYRFTRAVRAVRPDLSRLSPIFRDRDELSANHDLSQEIRTALDASERLIVVCSPAAAQSHWVDQEVHHFQQAGRAEDIVCLIVDGDLSDKAGVTLFPPALRSDQDSSAMPTHMAVEPLAADLRISADGRRLGLLKLIAGLARIRTDDLVQRDLSRARRRVMAVTGIAGSIVLSLTALTLIAMGARQEAEQRRDDVEGQIEFMLTDLRDKLEGVGRIDVLQPVGERAARYYEGYPLSAHDNDALGRRARVFHYLGEIQDRSGNRAESTRLFQQAYAATQDLLRRNPKNAERLFDHSQSAYWVGYAFWRSGDPAQTRPAFEEYLDLVTEYQKISDTPRLAVIELSNAHANLGVFDSEAKNFSDAIANFRASQDVLMDALETWSGDTEIALLLSDTYGWLASMQTQTGNIDASLGLREDETALLAQVLASDPQDPWKVNEALANAQRNIARIHLLTGDGNQAVNNGERALAGFKSLVAHDAANAIWQRGEARTLALMIVAHCRMDDLNSVRDMRGRLQNALAAMSLEEGTSEVELIEDLQIGKLKENCNG